MALSRKNHVNSQRSSKIVPHNIKALLRDRIHFHWHNKVSQLQKMQQLENICKSSSSNSDQHRIFTTVGSFFRNILNKQQKVIHICKFSWPYDQNSLSSAPILDSKKCILNLSKHILTDAEEAVLIQGLNFLVMHPHSSLQMACAVVSVVS
jgi:hypothetical protein